MLRNEIQALKTDPRELRKFGLLVGGVFALLAGWCWWKQKAIYPYFLIPAVPLLVLGLVWPAILRRVYIAWMTFALVLGLIVSTILLTVFYYLVVTPTGLLARAVGKDFLCLRLDGTAKSYWGQRPASQPKRRHEYEQQF